jgi:hypothetical protein
MPPKAAAPGKAFGAALAATRRLQGAARLADRPSCATVAISRVLRIALPWRLTCVFRRAVSASCEHTGRELQHPGRQLQAAMPADVILLSPTGLGLEGAFELQPRARACLYPLLSQPRCCPYADFCSADPSLHPPSRPLEC